MHETNETLRKTVHILAGLGAFALKFLTWQGAAAIAALATISNWLVLHRIVGKRVSRHERGWDAGIVLYPFCVLILILLFQRQSAFIAIPWVLLAFGDGAAGLIGRAVRIAPLPWNRDKSLGGTLAFLACGGAATFAVARFFAFPFGVPAITAVVAAAIVESLPLRVDDNITVLFSAATALAIFGTPPIPGHQLPPIATEWILANTLLAVIGYALRGVNLSGMVTGWILGCIIVIGGGPALYLPLLAFFIIGTLGTKLGFRRKAAAGLAQESGGRRGAGHAIANVGVAALCAIAMWRGVDVLVPLLMGIASLATAACDTTGSEIGQLFGRRAFLATTLRRVEPGTEGALSIEGTVAGIISGSLVALTGVAAMSHHLAQGFMGGIVIAKSRTVLVLTVCAFLGSYLESLAGVWNRRHGSIVPNGVLNFFNTAMGAMLFYVAIHFIPMFGFTL